MANDKLERANQASGENVATLTTLYAELAKKIGKQNVTIKPSTDGDILEITQGKRYIRIAEGETKNRQKPFSFYSYVSTATPDKPKTEIYERHKRPVTPMDADQLRMALEKLFPKESQSVPLIEGPRVPVSTEDIRKSKFYDNLYKLGDLDKLEQICTPGALVIIRHLGFDEGHGRSKVRIKEVQKDAATNSLFAKMEFIEAAPLRIMN